MHLNWPPAVLHSLLAMSLGLLTYSAYAWFWPLIRLWVQPAAPTFQELLDDEFVYFTAGTNTAIFSAGDTRTKRFAPFVLGGTTPIEAIVKEGVLTVNAEIWGGRGLPLVEVWGNKFKVRPPNWDRNSNTHALEIVDQDGIPVLQLTKATPRNVTINGVFPFHGGVAYLTNSGTFINPSGAVTRLKPIFKYPSWKYPGEYA